MHGPIQQVYISSNPSHASILLDGVPVGYTPNMLNMPRKQSHIVKIELQGYQSYEVIFSNHISRWAFGNLLFGGFGGVFGLAVDTASGGLYTLAPATAHAELRPDPLYVQPPEILLDEEPPLRKKNTFIVQG